MSKRRRAAFVFSICAAVTPACAASAAEDVAAAPPKIVDARNAEHYTWGGVNDGWHLVKREDLSVIRERVAPGGAEVAHFHRKARQFFQVLTGTLTIRVEGTDYILGPGQGIEIAPGLTHQALNASKTPVEMLVISMPMSHGDRVEVGEAAER